VEEGEVRGQRRALGRDVVIPDEEIPGEVPRDQGIRKLPDHRLDPGGPLRPPIQVRPVDPDRLAAEEAAVVLVLAAWVGRYHRRQVRRSASPEVRPGLAEADPLGGPQPDSYPQLL